MTPPNLGRYTAGLGHNVHAAAPIMSELALEFAVKGGMTPRNGTSTLVALCGTYERQGGTWHPQPTEAPVDCPNCKAVAAKHGIDLVGVTAAKGKTLREVTKLPSLDLKVWDSAVEFDSDKGEVVISISLSASLRIDQQVQWEQGK